MSSSPSSEEEGEEEHEKYSSSSSSSSEMPKASAISKTPLMLTASSSNGHQSAVTRSQTAFYSKEAASEGLKRPEGVVELIQTVNKAKKASNGETEPKKGNLIWEDHQFDYLVECLLEQACIPGMKVRGAIRPKGMRAVAAKMMAKFGTNFNLDKIRNKLKKAKRNLAICNDLLSYTGFKFDNEKKCLLVDYDVWNRHVKSSSEHKSFRNANRWKHYKELYEIFGESIPSGMHGVTLEHEFAHTSVEEQTTSNEPQIAVGGVMKPIQAMCEVGNATNTATEPEKRILVWEDHQFDYLVECLLEQSRIPGMKDQGAIEPRGMRAVEAKMMEKYGPEFNLDKIRNKLKKVKRNLAICKDLLSHNGFKFDNENKCLLVDNDVWNRHIKNYSEHKSFRNASRWKHYEELCEIFGESIPSGMCGVTVEHDQATTNELAITVGGVMLPILAKNEVENASDSLIEPEQGSLIWEDHQFDYLVECLLEQARIPGMKDRCGGIKSKGWKAVEAKMMAKFGPKFNREKIRNKLKKVKVNLAICKYLLSQSGFKFDNQKKCLVVDDDLWKKHIQSYRKHRSFRNASHWKHYKELCEIFGDFIPIAKDGVMLEPESVYAVVEEHATGNEPAMDLDDDEILCSLPPSEAAPSRSCRKIMSKKRKADALMAKGFSDLSDAIRTLTDSSSSGVMDKCSTILSDWLKEGTIDEEIYMETWDLFENERLPVLFIHCKPEMRLRWLERRLNMQKGQ